MEDESHFIFDCELYAAERYNFSKMLETFSILNVSASVETFTLIMSCLNGDADVERAVCNHIDAYFTIHTQALYM